MPREEPLDLPALAHRPMGLRRTRPNLLGQLARGIGSGRFLVIQSLVLLVWFATNAVVQAYYQVHHPGCLQLRFGVPHYLKLNRCAGGPKPFDPVPFLLGTLALSIQAAYAAPLILLAQNAEIQQSRIQAARDRQEALEYRQTIRYLEREIGAIRRALAEALTRDDFKREMDANTA